MIVHWPAGIKAKGELRHTPAHFVDFVPTLLELAGASAPATWNNEARPPLSGRSLVPAFAKDVLVDREFLFFKHIGNRGLRVGDWKIVAIKDGPWELYNLANDRAESNNLATAQPEKVKELEAIWTRQDEEFQRQGATGERLLEDAERQKPSSSVAKQP